MASLKAYQEQGSLSSDLTHPNACYTYSSGSHKGMSESQTTFLCQYAEVVGGDFFAAVVGGVFAVVGGDFFAAVVGGVFAVVGGDFFAAVVDGDFFTAVVVVVVFAVVGGDFFAAVVVVVVFVSVSLAYLV